MPTVPTYDAPQVAATELPGAGFRSLASPSLLNAGVQGANAALRINADNARGAADFGRTMLDIGVKMQARDDLETIFKQETTLKDGWVQFQNEARQRNGADAAGLTADTDAWFQQQEQELTKNFTTKNQQLAFAKTFGQLRTQAMSSMSAYETQERERSLAETAEASMNSSINLAATAALDPRTNPAPAAAQARDDIQTRLDVVGKMRGWTPEILADKKAKALDSLHMSVIAALIDNRPGVAKAYLKDNKDEINGVSQAKVRDWFDAIAKRNEGQALLATAQSFADDAVGKGMSEFDAINAARAKYSGKQEEHVVNVLKVRYSENYSAAARAAWDAVDKSGGDIKAVPVSVLSSMDGRDRISLEQYAEKKAEGKPITTDVSKWLEFTNKSIDQLAQYSPERLMSEYRPYLSDSDLRVADKMIQDARAQKQGAKIGEGFQLATTEQLLQKAATDIGILPASGKPNGNQQTAFNNFREAMQGRIGAWESATGKKADRNTLESLIDQVKQDKVRESGFFSDSNANASALSAQGKIDDAYVVVGKEKVMLSDIPKEYVASALRRAYTRGQRISTQQIAQMWLADGKPKGTVAP